MNKHKRYKKKYKRLRKDIKLVLNDFASEMLKANVEINDYILDEEELTYTIASDDALKWASRRLKEVLKNA